MKAVFIESRRPRRVDRYYVPRDVVNRLMSDGGERALKCPQTLHARDGIVHPVTCVRALLIRALPFARSCHERQQQRRRRPQRKEEAGGKFGPRNPRGPAWRYYMGAKQPHRTEGIAFLWCISACGTQWMCCDVL